MSKRMRSMNTNINKKELYTISNAFSLLKSQSKVKFVESVDVAVNLGIDARKSDQSVRGSVLLPCGTGRKVRVAVFADVDNAELARDAGADLVGLDDLATQVENGKIEFDLAIASPESMSVVGRIGRILGPRGLILTLSLVLSLAILVRLSEMLSKGRFVIAMIVMV
jgi:large subunit ribosomal protein L1